MIFSHLGEDESCETHIHSHSSVSTGGGVPERDDGATVKLVDSEGVENEGIDRGVSELSDKIVVSITSGSSEIILLI